MNPARWSADGPTVLREAALLSGAAETPLLSAGLRSRVLAAAAESARRRAAARRVLCGIGLCVALFGLSWVLPSGLAGLSLAGPLTEPVAGRLLPPPPAGLPVSQRYERGTWLVSAAGDEWRMVAAEFRARRIGCLRLAVSF